MKSKKFSVLTLAVAALLALSTWTGAAEFEKMTWKFTCSSAEFSTWMDCGRKFAEIMAEKTGGAVTVRLYASDQLTSGNQPEGVHALMDGSIELTMHSNMIWSAFDQRFSVVSLPFLFKDRDEAYEVLDGAGGEALRKILEENYNVHLLGIAESGFRRVTNNRHPIESLADMKNLKIRVGGSQLLNRCYQLWGADYTNASWSEVFTALQTGTFDGQENPLPVADSSSIQEVQKYMTYWNAYFDCQFFNINKQLYESLSPELQAIVDEAGREAVLYQRNLSRDMDQEIMERWQSENGIQISYLSDEAVEEFKAASAPVYEEFADRITPELMALFVREE